MRAVWILQFVKSKFNKLGTVATASGKSDSGLCDKASVVSEVILDISFPNDPAARLQPQINKIK
jgi:hypothetical protein